MVETYALFRLQGVMASWGEVVAGEVRTSESTPTRSALLGMLGAALGIEREDDAAHHALSRMLHIAVLVHNAGTPMEDYHTTQTPDGTRGRELTTRAEELSYKSLATILSRRTYYCDQSVTVAIWKKKRGTASERDDRWSLEEIVEAINAPRWTLSLGRKSCPLLTPPEAHCVQAKTLKQALQQRRFCSEFSIEPLHERLFWDEGLSFEEVGIKQQLSAMRRDEIHSRKNWTFRNRSVASAPWPSANSEQEEETPHVPQ